MEWGQFGFRKHQQPHYDAVLVVDVLHAYTQARH